jgi:zinc protease
MNRHVLLDVLPFVASAALGFSCALANAQATSQPPRKLTSIEGITEYRLDNELRVLLFPDQTRPEGHGQPHRLRRVAT